MARALSNPVYLASPEKGVDGRTTLAKARAPLITDGRIGDFFIDTVAKKLYGPKNAAGWPDNGLIKGDKGWAPVFGVVDDGVRRVQRVVDWQGGEGTKPATGKYVGATGLVDAVADAADIRGPEGPEMVIDGLTAAATDISDATQLPVADAGDDNEKRTVVEVFDLGGTLDRKSVAHAQATNVRKAIGTINVGGMLYKRTLSEPAVAASSKFRSLDRWESDGNSDSVNGGWWVLVEDVGEARVADEAITARKLERNVARTSRDVWRRTPVADGPLVFADYSTALAFTGGAYIYPQGFDFDGDGNIYINYASNAGSPTHTVIVVFDGNFHYLRHFYRPSPQSESIAITGKASDNTLKLYAAESANLVEYNLGALPANGSTLSAGTVKITGGCGSLFSRAEDRWIIQQLTVDLGSEASRTAWNMYDPNFAFISRFFVAKNVVGWQTSGNANYPYVPKTQGVSYRDGKVYFSVGGSYIPVSEPSGPQRAADYGVIECSPDGSVTGYGVCRADLFLARVAALGYSIERTENEGLAVGPDGEMYSLLITKRPASADANTTGLLLFKEMDIAGEWWDDISTPYKPAKLSRYSGQIWPRSADGTMRNPVSDATITTMDALLDLMLDMQLPDAAYFTAVHALTPVTGLPTIAGENFRVDLFNLNNTTIHCRLISTTNRFQHWYSLSKSGTWSATALRVFGDALYLTDGVAAPATRAGAAAIYVDTADGDLKVKFGDGTVKTIVTDT
ncbi:hypothetical protein IB238_05690 [Rhizobium sp. ARZ01]|uniref:hypothetical protein n=1 Tax=Rhizobium sp. ARZ01 TaxID=2769313 RepID=UPI0017865D1D|nr:hypothetical protein [Rhizobium sp. ARZ01]MBD9372122.1 hypothetical protein [Rhizobium sp. ARZ01]